MKIKGFLLTTILSLFVINTAFAAHPTGGLSIHNASPHAISAKINGGSGFKLAANQRKQVSYSTVLYACSSSPNACRADFYADNRSLGSATLNATTGKLLSLNVSAKVKTQVGAANILRNVVIR